MFPNIFKFRSREEIEAEISKRVQNGWVELYWHPRWKPSGIPKPEIVQAANDYAWSVFPEGGWGWFYAQDDYFRALGYEEE